MSDDIRSLIRAAQEAEGRREPLDAAGHLQRAAERLERSGRPARAVQLLRHAVRLSGDEGLRRHLEALERDVVAAGPPPPQREGRVFELDVDDADGELPFRPPAGTPGAWGPRSQLSAVSPQESAAPGAAVELTPQGQGVMSPEHPPVVGGQRAPVTAVPGSPVRTYRSDAGVGGLLLAHHVPVLGRVEVALSEGMRVVLLLGPQGSGRSTCLSALATRLGGIIVGPPFSAGFPPTELLMIDDAHRLEPAAWAELERTLRTRPKMRLVLAAPRVSEGSGPTTLVATTPGGDIPLWTTGEILVASPELSPALAGRVEQVVEVALPLPAQLERLARELLTTHRPQLRDPGPVAEVLVKHTLQSPRGLHELIALVHRLPMDVQAVRRQGPQTAPRSPRHPPAARASTKGRVTTRALAEEGASAPATAKRTMKAGARSAAAATAKASSRGARDASTAGKPVSTAAKPASTVTPRKLAKSGDTGPARASRSAGGSGARNTSGVAEVGQTPGSTRRGSRADSKPPAKGSRTRGSKKDGPSS